MKVKFKKLNPKAVTPKYAKHGDAGLDLTAIEYELTGGRHFFGTGISVEIPEGHVGLIFPRSSIFRQDLRLTNAVGVIDSGFRGEIRFVFDTHMMTTQNIYKVGERIGQLVIVPFPKIELEETKDLSKTERGDSGFGSSDEVDYSKRSQAV